jgi:hypothetical protein
LTVSNGLAIFNRTREKGIGMGYEKLERIEVRFAPKTGNKRPWEIWSYWSDRGSVFWASYKTEEAAKKKADKHWKRLKAA